MYNIRTARCYTIMQSHRLAAGRLPNLLTSGGRRETTAGGGGRKKKYQRGFFVHSFGREGGRGGRFFVLRAGTHIITI